MDSEQRIHAAARPRKEAPALLHCPRCNSANTKFCYYNNYSLQQPRYFCKTCRRYWTEGGSLRNFPVGGGSRKNKRSSSAAETAVNPKPMDEDRQQLPEVPAFPSLGSSSVCNPGAVSAMSVMELLRSTGCYVPLQHVQLGMPAEYAAAGFALGDFRMAPPPQSQSLLGFSLDTHAGLQESTGARLLFPFEDLKLAGSGASNSGAAADQFEHSKDHQAAGDPGILEQ